MSPPLSSPPRARRIHGRHPLLIQGGAAVDEEVSPEEAGQLAERWLERAQRLATPFLEAGLGAPSVELRGSHLSLVLPAPIDARDLAADLLDQVTGAEPEAELSWRPDLRLRSLVERAFRAELPAFLDEDKLVLGMGQGARVHSLPSLPADLGEARRVPFALVTGTNGKTTTANLLGAIAAAAGAVPGVATSTGIRVGERQVERGDWSGPGAARIVAQDPQVTFAVLETARGGLLRRGLLLEGADAVVLTNISDDHLGDWGIDTLDGLARVKGVVAESVRRGGVVVTRADDPHLERRVGQWHATRPDVRWLRFSSQRKPPEQVDAWLDGAVLRFPGGEIPLSQIPLTFGGAARHNVENALAAALAAAGVGLPPDAIARGLQSLQPDPRDNPGRSNLFRVRGATVLLDYAHNPDGLSRLGELARALVLPTASLSLLLGQAGDRPTASVLALARVAAELRCATYVLKPLPGYARGRDPEEVVALLEQGLLEAGVLAERIVRASSEREGVQKLLGALQPADLGILLVHEDLAGALAVLEEAGGQPGSP